MARMTRRVAEGKAYALVDARVEDAIARLGAFEDLYDSLLAEREKIATELEALRAENKQKTVRFKSLLAQKLTNQSTITLFEVRGL